MLLSAAASGPLYLFIESSNSYIQLLPSYNSSDAVRFNELVVMEGHTAKNDYTSPLPHEYVADEDVPVNVSVLFTSS